MKTIPVYLECYNQGGGRCYHGYEKSIAAAIRFAKNCCLFFTYTIFSEDKKSIIKRGFCI